MEKRNEVIFVRMTKTEKARVISSMKEMRVSSISAYCRKMILDGYCINLDLEPVRELVSLLRRCSNNLNQYAKKANQTGSIYEMDIEDLKARLEEIWNQSREIISRLSSIS